MLKNWLQAFRLKTLPLAFAAITMGAFVANVENSLRWEVYGLALLTATLLQILSNLANDYGDFKKGTDNENRVGPTRALQSGAITEKAMLNAVILLSILSLIAGIFLLYIGLQDFSDWRTLTMLGIGLAAIAAAIKYTVGKSAYGYSGLGDVFVFIFFGLVSVLGSYFLMTGNLTYQPVLPAISVGLLAVGVLNINNIRDIKNDKASNKITLAVKLGRNKAKTYQMVITLVAFLTLSSYISGNIEPIWFYLLATVLWAPVLLSYYRIVKNNEGEEQKLNNELKAYSLGTALLVFGLFGTSFLL
jgi:1,4-dihydroxy-2-naphthoate octaprenyltransferase